MRIVPLLIIVFLFFGTSCSDQKEGIKPQYRDVTEEVYSTVTVQPRNVYKVYPKMGGIIDEMYVNEGDEIKKGDLILKLLNNKSNVNIQTAQLKYEIARESYSGESVLLKEIEEQIKSSSE